MKSPDLRSLLNFSRPMSFVQSPLETVPVSDLSRLGPRSGSDSPFVSREVVTLLTQSETSFETPFSLKGLEVPGPPRSVVPTPVPVPVSSGSFE